MLDMIRDFEFKDAMLINFINLTDREKEMVRIWRNNENIRKWMYTKHVISRKEHSDFIERLRDEEENFYWLLKNRQGEYIGVIDLKKMDLVNKEAYLGIYRNPDCKLSGASYLLMECLKSLTFDVAGLQTLKLEVMNNNDRAMRFYKEAGFKEEDIRDEVSIMFITKREKIGHEF